MGRRLHYFSEYKVCPSDSSIGNWNSDIINQLFHSLANKVRENCWFDNDFISGANRIEIDKEIVEKIIEFLTATDNWEAADIDSIDVTELPEISEMKEFLKEALTKSEPSINTIHFEWLE